MRRLPCEQGHREIRALGDGNQLHSLPRHCNAGRHDHCHPLDAEGEDLLGLPHGIDDIATARAFREGIVCQLSRRTQQQPADALAGIGCRLGTETEVVVSGQSPVSIQIFFLCSPTASLRACSSTIVWKMSGDFQLPCGAELVNSSSVAVRAEVCCGT